MSYLDGSEQVVTEESLKSWQKANPSRFRCHFCGHKFVVGDKWRCIYTNDMPGAGGNPLVCGKCWEEFEHRVAEENISADSLPVATKHLARAEWRGMCEMFKSIKNGKYWSFIPDCQECQDAERERCKRCEERREDEYRSRRDPFC